MSNEENFAVFSHAVNPPGTRRYVRAMALMVLASLLFACASRTYSPEPMEQTGLLERAQSQTAEGLTVRAAVPSADESLALFGLALYDRDIQPVWLEITNQTDRRVRFAPVGIDPAYFSPIEVAYMHKSKYRKEGYDDMERSIADRAIGRWIWPGETRSGFVFTHLAPGTKAFNVDVFAGGESTSFSFFITVPGFEPDHADIDFPTLYRGDEMSRVDQSGLRDALAAHGCCTTDITGEARGLPLNAVFVGHGNDVLKALLRAGWIEHARARTTDEVDQSQHWLGRPADAVFRTLRSKGRERNELRVWRAPVEVEGVPVWMAQITHFIGHPTELGRALFDPRLDPDLDGASVYLLQLMSYRQTLLRYAWIDTDLVAPISAYTTDFRGVDFFTSGRRIVLWLSGEAVSQTETDYVEWDSPPNMRQQ